MLLRPGQLTLDELQAIHGGTDGQVQPLLIDPAALARMAGRACGSSTSG